MDRTVEEIVHQVSLKEAKGIVVLSSALTEQASAEKARRQVQHWDEYGYFFGLCIFTDQCLAADKQLDSLFMELVKQIKIWIAICLELCGVRIVIQDSQCCITVKDDRWEAPSLIA